MTTTGSAVAGQPLDGLQVAVLKNRFETVARAMTHALLRAGRSGVLNIARDFSCSILTADADLLAFAESIPVHVMSGPDLQARSMKRIHPDLARGDAFLHNSPYDGNSHAADWSVLMPVIDDDGVHRFTVFAKAHQADCGNSVPTTYLTGARDVYEEGALIFPCVKVQEGYELDDDVLRTIRERIRVPDQAVGDFRALVGAVRVGERRVLEMLDEYGPDTLDAFARGWFDYSEQRMVDAVRGLPAGSWTLRTQHDRTPVVPEGVELEVTVSVDPEEAIIDVDLTRNPDSLDCGLNLTESCARSAAMIGVFNSLGPTVPPNAGSYRRLRVRLREDCCVGIPTHPHSCSAATTDLMDRVANATMRCLGQARDGVGMAEFAYCIGAGPGVISGKDERSGRAFVNQLFLGFTGGAGSPYADGWLGAFCIGAAGMLMRDSVEVDELKHPIRIVQQRIVPDTEGTGRFRGAPAAMVEYGPTDGLLEVNYCADGTEVPPRGVRGGGDGGCAAQHVRRRDGTLEPAPNVARLTLQPGETVVAQSCGGGGYGVPWERDAERVGHDVREGYVSRERAERLYGLRFDAGGEIDAEATAVARAELAAATPAGGGARPLGHRSDGNSPTAARPPAARTQGDAP
jgi:N-methylhydantoinase B